MTPLLFPFPFPVAPQEIVERRAELLQRLIEAYPSLAACPVQRIPVDFFDALVREYDRLFFNGILVPLLPDLRVVPAPRMTVCAGKFCVAMRGKERVRCEIRMATDFLFRLKEGPFSLNGLTAQSALEAFVITFEHELCHALDLRLYGEMHAHGESFRTLVQGLFGHTACRHRLPTRAQEAAQHGIRCGESVRFTCEGDTYVGRVTRVGKTATVMVPSRRGNYLDPQGNRYAKYLVPPEHLEPLDLDAFIRQERAALERVGDDSVADES